MDAKKSHVDSQGFFHPSECECNSCKFGPMGGETTPPFGCGQSDRKSALAAAIYRVKSQMEAPDLTLAKEQGAITAMGDAHVVSKRESEVDITEEEAVATHYWKHIAEETAKECTRLHDCIDAWRDREEELMAQIHELKNQLRASEPVAILDEKGFLKPLDEVNAALATTKRDDPVDSPSHYLLGDGKVECVDAIKAALTEDEFRGWCKGNAMKYIWRSNHKGHRDQDLRKCAWFSRFASGDDPRE